MEELHQEALNVFGDTRPDISDRIAGVISSNPFILVMSIIIIAWITFNALAGILRFDLYPFVLLNLTLGLMSAYTGPFVMMSQNKTERKDRKLAEYGVQVNRTTETKAEEILAVLHSNLEHSEETRHDIELIYESLRGIHTELNAINHPKRTHHV